MRDETSAGGVIVRKNDDQWEVLLICDSKGKWTFPKGHMELDETHLATAIREIGEEVGVQDLRMCKKLIPVQYIFTRDGVIKKTVHFFLFQTAGDRKIVVQRDEGITDSMWAPLDAVADIIGYPKTNMTLIQESIHYLSHHV